MTLNRRVLCVDDHEDTRALVANTLTESDLVSASDASEALRLAASERFDLMLVDYYLPDDLVTPILIMTASHSITHEQAVSAGAQGVMRKDHLAQLLPGAVARLLELRLDMSRRIHH